MVGADSIIKIIAVPLAIFTIAVITGIGVQLIDPIYSNVINPDDLQAVGWGGAQNTVMMFFALGTIGLSLAVFFWIIASPIRDDQRQDQRPPRGPL